MNKDFGIMILEAMIKLAEEIKQQLDRIEEDIESA